MAVTVLSGTSGALYYKPAGTTSTFGEAGVAAATDIITVAAYLNFKVGDPVKFRVVDSQTGGAGSGTLPAPSTPAELQALLKKDIAKWGRVIREKNITAD